LSAAWEDSVFKNVSCSPPAADQKLYFDHVRAVIVELVNIAIIKNYGLDISSDARVFIADYLRHRDLAHIDSLSPDSLTGIYNRAFGIPGQDGIASITAAFSDEVTRSRMKPETLKRFYLEFYGILKSLFDEMKGIKLFAAR
jgi:hypothetical protein